MNKSLILPLLAAVALQADAQTVKGIVFEQNEKKLNTPLAGASIYFPGTTTGTTSGIDGRFQIDKPEGATDSLVFSYVGFATDTLAIPKGNMRVILHPDAVLQTVEITGSRPESFISRMDPIKTEVLTTAELKKNACCNLSESFESNPTVDVSFSDAVTGARQIRMLGLSGRYVQTLQDLLPAVRGLNTTYGFNNIPGPWVENIYVVKGAGSVVNGFESVTGQIDVELKKPEQTDRLYLNAYGNNEGRAEFNATAAQALGARWSTMVLAHGSTLQNRVDHNGDSFMDQPLTDRFNVMNRWKYESGKRIESMAGFAVSEDRRLGGDIRFDERYHRGTTQYYGTGFDNRRWEAFAKTSLAFAGYEHKSLGLQLSVIHHDADGYFGLRGYTGRQRSVYANLIYLSGFRDTRHAFKTGASMLYDHVDEAFASVAFSRRESIPGAYFEYTFDDLSHWTVIVGLRGDYSDVYDLMVSPRVHIRYKAGPHTVMRVSAGRGYHAANVLSEQSAVMASSRELVVLDKPGIEAAWNYGVNITRNLLLGIREMEVSADLYRTDFTNQVVTDLYADATRAYVFNLRGRSFSNNLQLQATYALTPNLKVKAAIKFYDVQTDYLDGRKDVPLSPSRRGLINLAYETRAARWKFDFTTQWVGRQQLPAYAGAAPDVQRTTSPDYIRLLGQITFKAGRWDLYAGGENLGDYTQPDPIVHASEPFGPYFDGGIVWGPLTGRMFYAGLRYVIERAPATVPHADDHGP